MTDTMTRPRASTSAPGNPRLRASDAERDDVAAQLREHFAAGRLSAAESQERISQALEARTHGELAELLADLPGLGSLAGPGRWPGGAPGDAVTSAPGIPPAAGPGGILSPAKENDSRAAALTVGIIVAAYLVTWLITGIWWIPWALFVVPAVVFCRRSRGRASAPATGRSLP
jgi:Domain of unknown function (DUF1707)